MAVNPEYCDYIIDLLTPHYPVTTRKMFGGLGIFCEFGMCALITSEDVYFGKVDDENRDDYLVADMPQFAKMPYYQVPVEVLDSEEEVGAWLEKSIAAARRAAAKKSRK